MNFYKGGKDVLEGSDDPWGNLTSEFSKLFDIHNLSFLFGAGCSSYVEQQEEKGIPTMCPLATQYYETLLPGDRVGFEEVHINIDAAPYVENLEAFNEAVLNYRNYISQIEDLEAAGLKERKEWIDLQVKSLRQFILKKCTQPFEVEDNPVLSTYKSFYRKLIFRDRNLPKPNIFTTNYDVFTEVALDSLGVHFSNGFSGVLNRYFNPSVFDYAFSENLNVRENKWQVIDHYIYLYKLHGSINWVAEPADNHLYGIREIQDISYEGLKDRENIMIYPTPAKQSASLSSPYTDLFRELKQKLSLANGVLVVAGYSFGDEHVNTLIYQALSKPTFRLVVLGNPADFAQLIDLGDPRIWVIGGEDENGERVHYFNNFVEKVMPDLSEREIEESIEKIIKKMVNENARR